MCIKIFKKMFNINMFFNYFNIIILSFFTITTKKKNIEENFINDNLDIQVKAIGNGKK